MRTFLNLRITKMQDEFTVVEEVLDFVDFAAGRELKALNYYIVPANTGICHDQYSGVLTFRIVNI